MQRRTFLGAAAGSAILKSAGAQRLPFPVIDSHVHLYDPARPQGVPWPSKNQKSIYRTFLPADFRKIAEPLGVVGMIEVECSPWVEDNYWVLEAAARDTVVVGTVGSLHPGKPDFREHLGRLRKNRLFRGIRYGYLWGRNPGDEVAKPEVISDLKALAEADLTMDTAGPPRLLADVLRIAERVPDLRIVIDHLPGVEPPREPEARAAYEGALREISKLPRVYVKVSQVFQRVDANGQRTRAGGRIPKDLAFYRPVLDAIYETFGPDRVIFASDWTNSEPMGTFAETVNVVHEYFGGKGRDVAEKFFWKNSLAAYKWAKRSADQPQAAE